MLQTSATGRGHSRWLFPKCFWEGRCAHFDPNQGVSLNRNNQVTAWTNQADTSRSATTEATTITLTSLQNGQKMLAFNSENNVGHLAYGGSASSQFSAGYTVFAVVNLTVAADNTYMRVHRSADDAHALFYGKRSDLNSYESIQMKTNPLPMADRPTVGYDGGLVILTSRVTPSRQELYVNGTLVDSNGRGWLEHENLFCPH